MGILPTYVHSNKIESAPSLQDKKEGTIVGKITDKSGEPIVGATIKVKGSSVGTVSDVQGNYRLQAPSNAVIQFSFMGYTSKEQHVKGRSTINVVLEEDSKVLDELVVIGYGTVKKRSITGSVDQVKKELIEDKPVANVTQALQGVAPNLIIQRKSYNPTGESTNINIRGISTINSNAPLIVIDGLVSSDGSLNDLNPNDIDNISILKDAGSASIYGSRSSNGVILVTTKKGKNNNPTEIKLSSAVGFESPRLLFHPVMGYQNASLKNLALVNSNRPAEFTP
ncbi:MAG: TonB-dependent receptor plug domain-containing protein, partial [Prevotella nanceiensis]|nr:TonB-dependent receptor plug domain-containing protein [Hoylesella nanceiensis]